MRGGTWARAYNKFVTNTKVRTKAKVFNALMDPGAELNLVRRSLISSQSRELKLNIHAQQPTEAVLFNNGVEIGRVTEAVYLSFQLDKLGPVKHEYDEWFYVWEHMNEEMILGSAFCRQQGFTNFHLRLAPWSDKLSNNRAKRVRSVEQIDADIACEDDERTPYAGEDDQLLPCPLSQGEGRQRSRVMTPCEKIDQFQNKHSKQKDAATVKQAGCRRASKHLFAPVLSRNSHENRSPVKYNQVQSKHISRFLVRNVIDEHKVLLKQMQQLRDSDVVLTSEELETLKDTAKLCALEAARWAAGTNNSYGDQELRCKTYKRFGRFETAFQNVL
jgi:hypothetical protein